MPPDSEEKPGAGWFSKSEMANVFNVSRDQFDAQYRRFATPVATKRIGRQVYFHSRSILNAWKASLSGAAPQTDPLLDGIADSPGLERYREARADLAEMERDRIRENLIPRDELEPALSQFAGVLRRAGETLARQFGNEAAAVLNEAVDETVEAWQETFGGVTADV